MKESTFYHHYVILSDGAYWLFCFPMLGTDDVTKTDEFSEKFQTALVTKVHTFIMAGLLCII